VVTNGKLGSEAKQLYLMKIIFEEQQGKLYYIQYIIEGVMTS
jgi:hypothetical protein